MNLLIYRLHIDDNIPAGSVILLDLKCLTRLGEHYRLSTSPSALFLFHTGAYRLRIKYVHSLELSGRSDRQKDNTASPLRQFSHYFQRKRQLLKLILLGWERKGKEKSQCLTSLLVEIGLKFIIATTRKECGHQHSIQTQYTVSEWCKHINIQPKMVRYKTN